MLGDQVVDPVTIAWGAGCFGLVIGWVASKCFIQNPNVNLTWLTSLIGIVAGGAVATFVGKPYFAPYSIGLATAFFIGLFLQGAPGKWLGKAIIAQGAQEKKD
jgi:hypothetical protein